MSYSIDVNGNDNQPEWGYCTVEGCTQPAYPIWYSGGFPDEPDLLLCEAHIGARILRLEKELEAAESVVVFARAYNARPYGVENGHWRARLDRAIAVYDAALDAVGTHTPGTATPSAETIAERARRFNKLLGHGPGREASDG